MPDDIPEVVIGATRRELRVTFVDENKAPIPITGGSVRLQGTSEDTPPLSIDVAGTIFDGAGGVARWTGLGGTAYVTMTALNGKAGATYKLKAKFTDGGGNVDWTPAFYIRWVPPPV
jgi:hypothetical protein